MPGVDRKLGRAGRWRGGGAELTLARGGGICGRAGRGVVVSVIAWFRQLASDCTIAVFQQGLSVDCPNPNVAMSKKDAARKERFMLLILIFRDESLR